MHDYVIAVGGTGSRVLEGLTYLAAAGLLTRSLHVLIVDPDQNNGNGRRTRQLVEKYDRLQRCLQPAAPRSRGWSFVGVGRKELGPPVLFRAPFNHPGREGAPSHPHVWRNSNPPTRRFEDVIGFKRQASDFQDFLRLFYQESDLGMTLNAGYRGRTSVGAVALKLDLDNTVTEEGGGLRELVAGLQADLQNGRPRVFVAGSVFGGTGAAALPTIPSFIRSLDPALIGPNVARLQFGCAMLIPYFSFPKGTQGDGHGPAPDSDEHMIATQAALLHYAQVPPGYQHVYLVGAPEQFRTATAYEPGDEPQINAPHYAELVSALGVLDFFGDSGPPARDELHFANDTVVSEGAVVPQGISWTTLPAPGQAHDEVKRRLVSFTTFAYFYKNFLHRAFVERNDYMRAPWYRDNFGPALTLGTHRDALNTLYEFSDSYLAWLGAVGNSGGTAMGTLFRWEVLPHSEIPLCAEYVGHLTEADTGAPRFLHDGYHQILKRMDALVLEQAGTPDPVGLLIYLLYRAVEAFCEENYRWRH